MSWDQLAERQLYFIDHRHRSPLQVASPMSGTFYHSPAPGEPPFVKVGDKVTKGQTIGIIEAMKLMNEIEVSTPYLCHPGGLR